jgi:hypothetical protein
MTAEQTAREEAVDDLVGALGAPDLFRCIVDGLEPSPPVTMLKLWGLRHGVYPGVPLTAADLEDLLEWLGRRVDADDPTG